MEERILLSPPHVTERDRQALIDAFDSGWVAPAGPEIDAFERELAEFCDVEAVVALSSGTAALQLALQLAGVERGDHVLCQSFTFIATANAALAAGAVPVFIDSESATWNLDPELVAEELAFRARNGDRVGAVVAVDLYGRCADYDRLATVCDDFSVPLVEDAAESLGSRGHDRPAGGYGQFGVLSFNGNKIITTSGGGALLCHDHASADRARYLATQARQTAPHYEHTESGYNFRLSNLLAGMGRSQLAQLPDRVDRRRQIRHRYAEGLADLERVSVFRPQDPSDNAWLTCIELTDIDREKVRLELDQSEIESRPLWKPMHLQPVFSDNANRVNGTSEALFGRGLCLPSGSVMSDDDVERVIDALRRAVA
ncbi:MAG: aminotransferase class V-fold PLP-dependent enzyme [Acidimicrobiales bacterium]|nr:aminotransferase class V-fold PLP-dependent enzyme [Acidimicrobiales bacterium]